MTATTPGPRLLLALTPHGVSVDVAQEPSAADVAARRADDLKDQVRDPHEAFSAFTAMAEAVARGVPPPPQHPLRPVLTELAAFAAGILPHRIVGSPDKNDALALVDDLLLLCAKVDKVVEAYGDYAAEHFHGIEKPLFKDQLLNALDCNALYEITTAGERADEEQREIDADPRGFAKAERLGVD